MAKFSGFPPQTLGFLRGLGRHNDKAWLHAHRADYEAYWLEPAKALVEALGERLHTIAPAVQAVPRVDASIFRINRDVRFASGKGPYKEHLDLWLWEGPDRSRAASGFYVRLTARALTLAVGIREFSREQLARYRAAVHAGRSGAALARVQGSLAHPLQGQRYARVPRGFDRAHPRADLLRHAGLWAGPTISPVPAVAHTGRLAKLCVDRFAELVPLHRWLVTHAGEV